MLNILKALTSTKWGKQKKLMFPYSKLSLAPFWNTQTPYGALSYQTPTSRNCKPFKTQLCKSLLAGHKIQTLNTYMMKPKSFQWTCISNFMLLNLNN